MVTRLWWVRHGPTHAKAMIGWTDLPADLSDLAALARLRVQLPQRAVVVSSDLIRAVATADALTGPDDHRLPHDPALRELHFGAWENRTHAEVEAEDPARLRAFWEDPGLTTAPGGEGWGDLQARIGAAIARLLRDHAGRDIILVAHFGAILAALQAATGATTPSILGHRIEPLSITELALHPTGWQVGRINHRP